MTCTGWTRVARTTLPGVNRPLDACRSAAVQKAPAQFQALQARPRLAGRSNTAAAGVTPPRAMSELLCLKPLNQRGVGRDFGITDPQINLPAARR